MTRRDLLKGIAAGLIAVVGSALWGFRKAFGKGELVAEKKSERPNFVFFLIDDMGWMDAGCQGSTFYQTPNIDKLAAQGMRFTDAYAACPVCSPTRASILTGRYPATINLTDYIPGRNRPWAKVRTPKFNLHLPPEEHTIAAALKSEGYATGYFGKWHLGKDRYTPDKFGFDHVVPRAGSKEDKMTSGLTEEACRFIDANRDGPFFLYIAHYAVHTPIKVKPELVEKYKARVRPGAEQDNPGYAGMIEALDTSVGKLMDKLDELDLADNTAVIFFSDNGGLLVKEGVRITSNAPLRGGKGMLYEGGIREPMIIRLPGVVAPGGTCDEPVTSVDFHPTILEMAGVKAKSPNPIDGVSLFPLLKGTGRLNRGAIYWHYPHYHLGKPSGAIRQGDWKLIEFYEDGRLELYNLKDDLSEKNNLATKNPEKATELTKELDGWRKRVKARTPTPNPDYDPARADQPPPRPAKPTKPKT